jgi:hypothetical protein
MVTCDFFRSVLLSVTFDRSTGYRCDKILLVFRAVNNEKIAHISDALIHHGNSDRALQEGKQRSNIQYEYDDSAQ